jgi:carbon-monoxide dehydrogenase medium subunit
MYAFEYHRPQTLSGALADLENQDAKALAGGQTLIPTMKQRLASPSAIVELKSVPELTGLAREGDNVVIGAMTRHAEVASSPVVRSAIPALSKLASGIGDAHVRNRGTIGGSLANNDPAADYPAAVLALGATVVTSKRRIAADDYFGGLFETALESGELITQVSFPIPQKAAYMKFANPASRFALVGVFVAKTAGGIRVAVTGAGQNGVFRVPSFEAALSANFAPAALDGLSVPADDLNTDIHAAADYRAHLIGVMAKRAVAAAA